MSARRLPRDPSLEHLRNQAKTLQRQARAGDPAAAALVRELHPQTPDPTELKRTDAQLVVARTYGFASWAQLRAGVETVAQYARFPQSEVPGEPPADRLARLACLTYGGGDGAARWQAAAELVAAQPELSRASIYTAAAVGDIDAARALVDADPGLARRPGGPHGWEPLLYACYSRVPGSGAATLQVARLLLSRGADANAGYLWGGTPPPFTALTGTFGYGEDAPNQPPHEREPELARLLLEAGADPNDEQTLYNNHWRPGSEHLELLFEHGLGRGAGGPWQRRLATQMATPGEMLEDQLVFAASRGNEERVALLLRHGVAPDGRGTRHPTLRGSSAYELAIGHGHASVAALLAEAGATRPPAEPVDELLAAAMRGDASTVRALVRDAPGLAEAAVARDPGRLRTAAEIGRAEAVPLLVEIGFDVNAKQRTTALHQAAWNGNVALARLLLELGADPTIRDDEFDATPAGWADHAHHEELAAYLASLEP